MSTLKILFWLVIINLFPASTLGVEKFHYLLTVNIQEKTLILYEIFYDEEKELRRYPIAVPQNDWLSLPLIGEVKRIEFNPWWYPTKATRITYLQKKGIDLPNAVPPGDPKNAMGKAKITIVFEKFGIPIRIHGTNDPSSIGKRISRGCIRMYNENVLELTKIVKNSKTKIIIR